MNDETKDIQDNLQEAMNISLEGSKINILKSPKAFVLGGQPGAGKGFLITDIRQELEYNTIVINGDDYRKLHPKYKDFQKEHGKDAPQYTAKFAGMMTEAVLNKAIKEHYNIIIEGTFWTAETPIKTLNLLKENGYETSVGIKVCDEVESWKGCINRYNKMLAEDPLEARYTDKSHHDLVVKNLPENVEKVFKSGLVDRMKVFDREKLLFDSKLDKEFKPDIIRSALHPQLSKDKSRSLER